MRIVPYTFSVQTPHVQTARQAHSRFGQRTPPLAMVLPLRPLTMPNSEVTRVLEALLPQLILPMTMRVPAKDGGEVQLSNGERGNLKVLSNSKTKVSTISWQPESPIKMGGTKLIDRLEVTQKMAPKLSPLAQLLHLESFLNPGASGPGELYYEVKGYQGKAQMFANTLSQPLADQLGLKRLLNTLMMASDFRLNEAKENWVKAFLGE